MNKENKSSGTGIAMGLIFGVLYWIVFDNIALGIALGVALGIAFEAGNSKKDRDNKPPSDSNE